MLGIWNTDSFMHEGLCNRFCLHFLQELDAQVSPTLPTPAWNQSETEILLAITGNRTKALHTLFFRT